MFTPANHKYGAVNLSFLDAVGNQTGSINMAVDGSVTPVEFKIKVPLGYAFQLEAVTAFLQDGGGFAANGYGGIGNLTNGTQIELRSATGAVLSSITAQLPIRSNADWIAYAYRINTFDFAAGESILSLAFNFTTNGRPLYLGPGMEYVIIINDDLTALSTHYFTASYVSNKIQ
jgi:hypothetical protein